MQHPDEGTIHAWIDGELSAEDAAALEAHLKDCAECSALAAEARGLAAASSRIVSALDIVPGDVIPKTARKHRAWYTTTQLRAAAAVVIVAGASLLVLKNGGQSKMQRAMEPTPASVAADAAPREQELDRIAPAPEAAKPVRIAEAPAGRPSASKPVEKKQSIESERNEAAKALEGRVAGVATNDAAFGAAKPVQPVQAADTAAARRRFGASQLSQVVVTGVATTNEAGGLKKIRADSSKNETVYEIRPGLEVTLTDNGQPAKVVLRASAQAKERQLAAPVAAPAPPPPAANAAAGAAVTKPAPVDSISWTSKRGHVMKLKGPLSRDELEKIRQRLPEDQR